MVTVKKTKTSTTNENISNNQSKTETNTVETTQTNKKLRVSSSSITDAMANSKDEDFAADLMKQINKEIGLNIAYDLEKDDAPTNVKRWIPTGSEQLDYIISNKRGGGLPEGRIVEFSGPSGVGKSTLLQIIAGNTQKMGGIVVYIDTENATSKENLKRLGVDTRKNFVFIQEVCTEDIFETIESVITKAKNLKNDIPVTVIWDSIAASAPKAELEADYDQNSVGLQARAMRKGLRKISQIIGNQKVLLILSNHITMKIGVMFGNPETTTGGTGPGFFSTVRIRLNGGQQIKDGENVVGIRVTAKTIKNRLTAPFREAEFQIMFGKGLDESEMIFDTLRAWCDKNKHVVSNGKRIKVEGGGTWKYLHVFDDKTGEIILEKAFQKAEFMKAIRNNPEYKEYIDTLMDAAFIMSQEELDEHSKVYGNEIPDHEIPISVNDSEINS